MGVPKFGNVQVLVTGGAGFIGSNLVDALISRGARVRVLDDLSTGSKDNLAHHGEDVDLVVGDICDLDTCQRAMTGVEYLFHQAALGSVPRSLEHPANSLMANVTGTANVFQAARDANVKRVVYASSSSVYGDSEALPKREGTEGRVLSPYAMSKHMDEELARLFGDCYGLEIVGLRYFNIFGPRQSPNGAYAAVIPRFIAAYRANEAPTIHGDGEQSRDFTFVEDAVAANLLASGAPSSACSRAFNIGAGGRTTVNNLANTIAKVCGSSLTPTHLSERAGDVRHSNADCSAAKEALGYAPRFSLEEGLARTIDGWR